MTQFGPLSTRDGFDDPTRTTLHWGSCFVLVTAAFGGLAWLVVDHMPAPPVVPAAPPAAVMLDLTPLPSATPAPVIPASPEIAPPPPPSSEGVPEAQSEPPVSTPSPALPVTPPSPAPSTDIPLPPDLPPQPPPRDPRSAPYKLHRKPAKPIPVARVEAASPQAAAAPLQPPNSPTPAAPAPRPNAVSNWQGLLSSRLERFKRYPEDAQTRRQQGVAYLHFAINRRGKVLAARIVRSSGFEALDNETLALIHRAEPLPPPPVEIAGDPLELTVPVQFSLSGIED